MNRDELRQLMDAAVEGDITEADFLRLEAELSIDPATRREYLDRLMLTTLLEAEATTGTDNSPEPVRSVSTVSAQNWRWAFTAMAVLCASLLLVIAWQGGWSNSTSEFPKPNVASRGSDPLESSNADPQSASNTTSTSSEQQSSGFAIVSGQAEADWEGTAFATGTIVPPGELRLKSGVAQFELFSGVTLVVEGDATFSILSPMEVSIASGKVRARVPEPALGFRLLTRAGKVVDLGTEFAVNVSADQSEVHVLDGEIEWHPNGLPLQLLKQGDAARSDSRGQTAITADPSVFVAALDVQLRMRNLQQERRQRWSQICQELTQDGNLIAHYQLTPDAVSSRRLPNLASRGAQLASEGAVVAATAAQNRWGDAASALDFSPAGSRVRLQVPGEYRNLTLMSWVRINSLDRWYNSLFLTDGHEQSEPHWQIMDDGRLFFSVKKRDQFDLSIGEHDKHVFFSPPCWNSSHSGRWLLIATVYDSDNRLVTHYLNGEVISQEKIPEEYLVDIIRIGDASLCNWGLPERDHPRFAIRNLNGCLDEFLLFATPLPTKEIERLYELSRP